LNCIGAADGWHEAYATINGVLYCDDFSFYAGETPGLLMTKNFSVSSADFIDTVADTTP